MADKYMLRVTAGPSYDPATHVQVPVNTSQSVLIESPYCTSRIQVSIRNYRGLPRSSPSSSSYFEHHAHRHDQYSIAFAFVPHQDVACRDLVFGNDFDRPLRDRLPPGFNTALRIVKWAIDPGLDGDVYADQPYLYGPLLSSVNILRVMGPVRGPKNSNVTNSSQTAAQSEGTQSGTAAIGGAKPETNTADGNQLHTAQADASQPDTTTADATAAASDAQTAHGVDGPTKSRYDIAPLGETIVEEGADETGEHERTESSMPATASERRTWALKDAANGFVWRDGYLYHADFFNPYLDFNDFSLKLPGFSLGVLSFLGGKEDLRYVLKDKTTGHVFFVVVLTLVLKEDVEKEEAAAAQGSDTATKLPAEQACEATKHATESTDAKKEFEPSADNVD